MPRSVLVASVISLLIGGVIGMSLAGGPAIAQQAAPQDKARYQISAYAGYPPSGVKHGYYIIDTTTAEVWHTPHGGTTTKVSDKLP